MELPDVDDKKAGNLYSKTDLLKAASEFFNDALPRMGFQEDHFWTNIRIILCMICCSFGCYAQFVLKFPKDRIYIGVCVAGYFLFSGLVAFIDMFVIKTSVICIKVSGQTVFVDVTMLPFSQDMEIGLRNRIGPKRKAEVSYKTSVGHYFDSDGYLGQEEILAEFMKLVKKFEKEHSKEAEPSLRAELCSTVTTTDPHDILGVPRGAKSHEIRQAYLKKAKQFHPDTSNQHDSNAAFQQLQAAYKALIDREPGPHKAANSSYSGSFQGSFHCRHGFPGAYTQQVNKAKPSKPVYDLLWEARAWRYGGLVHRSLHRFARNCMGCWPIWLLLSAVFLAGGRSQPGMLHYNAEGHAYVKQFGQYYRTPQYDDIPD